MSTISFRIDGDSIKCTHHIGSYKKEEVIGFINHRQDSRSLIGLNSPFDLTTGEIRVLCDILDEELNAGG